MNTRVQTMEVSLLHFIDKVVDIPVVAMRQTHSCQKTIEIHHLQVVDKVNDVHVALVVQVPHVQVVERTLEIPQVQAVEKTVEMPQFLSDVQPSLREVFPTLVVFQIIQQRLLIRRQQGFRSAYIHVK